MGMTGPRVAFICVAPEHLDQSAKPSDHLTIHEKEWAYCPRDARAAAHEWKQTGGAALVELELIVRGMRHQNGNGNGTRPEPVEKKEKPVRAR
jgi:ribosomal protein L44E